MKYLPALLFFILYPKKFRKKKKLIYYWLFRQEEQKWLDALERGELDDFGRVKQDKDVSMMTARQVCKSGSIFFLVFLNLLYKPVLQKVTTVQSRVYIANIVTHKPNMKKKVQNPGG